MSTFPVYAPWQYLICAVGSRINTGKGIFIIAAENENVKGPGLAQNCMNYA